jgi:HAD superfamily hydrolase (TIGR01490 family)
VPGAAFYDLDGTLIRTNLVHALAFFARNDRGILRSLASTAATYAAIPLFFAADLYGRRTFNNLFFRWYRGQSEDRLRVLSDELFEEVMKPSLFPGARALVEHSRSRHLRQVLVTGALDFTLDPLVRDLGLDDYGANQLDFVDGFATGHLVPPVMAGPAKAAWIRAYAEREGLSLADSYGYADSISDLPMLSVVGHPTPTNPDLRLRSVARENGWPIVSLA